MTLDSHTTDRLAHERAAARLGGAALLAATVLFVAVFSYLASAFGYPDVLDRPASEVLPALLGLGDTGRLVWIVYALVPLLLVPTGLGVRIATATASPLAGRGALVTGVLAGVSMMIGLLRWPSLHWRLAAQYARADGPDRATMAAIFDGANSYLGNFIGEFVGELWLNAFFALSAVALAAASGRGWLRSIGLAVSAIGLVAMFRNATPLVGPVAEINNLVLPLWMAVLGWALWTHRPAPRA